jgi:hypothetical protein
MNWLGLGENRLFGLYVGLGQLDMVWLIWIEKGFGEVQ